MGTSRRGNGDWLRQKQRLTQHGLAGHKWGLELPEAIRRPLVIGIISSEERHQGTRVGNYRFHSP